MHAYHAHKGPLEAKSDHGFQRQPGWERGRMSYTRLPSDNSRTRHSYNAPFPGDHALLQPTLSSLTLCKCGLRGHAPDLLDQKLSLIDELLVVRPVLQELRQESQ